MSRRFNPPGPRPGPRPPYPPGPRPGPRPPPPPPGPGHYPDHRYPYNRYRPIYPYPYPVPTPIYIPGRYPIPMDVNLINRDYLTRFYNRDYFNLYIRQAVLDYTDNYLILIKINNYIPINVNYGSQFSDNTLIQTSNILTQLYPNYMYFTFSNDTFAVLVNNVTPAEINAIATNIYNQLNGMLIQTPAGEIIPLSVNVAVLKITNSADINTLNAIVYRNPGLTLI